MEKSYLYKLFFITILSFATGLLGQNLSNRELVKKGKNATVLVKVKDHRGKEGFATAFCIDKSGLFVTNYHVLKHGFSGIQLILHPGKRKQRLVKAKVIRQDKEKDLALLQVINKGNFSIIELGLAKNLYETMEVMAFGFPFGKALAIKKGKYPAISVNLGRISSLREEEEIISRVQLDVMLNPGNSGGPVIDKQGKVVGVVAFGVYGSGVNFAIPINHLKRFLRKPVIQFAPPKITKKNIHTPVEFAVQVAPFIQLDTSYVVELQLKFGKSNQQSFILTQRGNIYRKNIIPFWGNDNNKLNVEAIYPKGLIKGVIDDGQLRAGNVSIKMSKIKSIILKPKIELNMIGGKSYFPSAIIGLKSVKVQLGGKVFKDLSKAVKINIKHSQSHDYLSYRIVVKESNKVVKEEAGNIWIEGIKEAIPSGFRMDQWRACWKGKWLDFTAKVWVKLNHNEQVAFAKAYQQWYAKKQGLLSVEKEFSAEGMQIKMVLIPPGRFFMGSWDSDNQALGPEKPRHKVTIEKAFWLGKTEVTQSQWLNVMNSRPSRYKGNDRPVEQVDWNQSRAFCEKIGSKLPSETQWEYACRSGTKARFYWGNEVDGAYCWYGGNAGNQTHSVGEKKPNAFGLYDMSGNVWEWCEDKWSGNYDNARRNSSGSDSVIRGGCYWRVAQHCRSAHRGRCHPGYRGSALGFRVVRAFTGYLEKD